MQMEQCMIKIQDENGSRKINSRQFPDPGRSVANEDHFECPGYSTPLRFLAQQQSEFGRRFKTPDVGSGILSWRTG